MPKPVKKKKKFISKKESTTYKLIPGYVDDDAEVQKEETEEEIAARKEEERKYGVFFNDNYNYMKHLRSMNEAATMVNTERYHLDAEDDTRSVSSHPPVFFEMFSTDADEGESIDPDILAALDEAPVVTDETAEDEAGAASFLDDDFISMAGGLAPAPVVEEEEWSDEEEEEEEDFDDDGFGVSDDDSDQLSNLHGETRGTLQDDIAEAQTALILRNFEEGLGFRCSTQDADEDLPGEADYEQLKAILEQDSKAEERVSWSDVLDDRSSRPKIDPLKYQYEDEDEIVWREAPRSKPKFDCVSILSLNSNTRNLPTDILPPSSKPKKPEPSEKSEAGRGLSLQELEEEMRESRRAERADRASTFRPKGESGEEKRARKKAIKDERKDRRHEKKANRQVFTLENEKMKKETAALAKSVKSVRIG